MFCWKHSSELGVGLPAVPVTGGQGRKIASSEALKRLPGSLRPALATQLECFFFLKKIKIEKVEKRMEKVE